MAWVLASTGNPKEKSTPRSTRPCAKACVASTESDRANNRGPCRSPGRGRAGARNAANASPPATSGRSRKHSSGWNPKVRFQVAAAFCFSEWLMLIVASKSRHNSPVRSGAAPAAHAFARAAQTPSSWSGPDAVQHPPRRRHRGDRPEQFSPIAQRRDAADHVRASSDRGRRISEHPTWRCTGTHLKVPITASMTPRQGRCTRPSPAAARLRRETPLRPGRR